MSKYDKYLQPPKDEGVPKGKYDQYVAPPPKAEPPPAEDPLWYRIAKTTDDGVRAFVDSMTFGLADRGLAAAGLEEDAVERTAQARVDSPYATLAGDVAGMMVPGALASKGVGMATGLVRNTIPQIMAREGIAGAAIQTIDDLIREGEINPIDSAISGATSAAGSGILAGGARLFPMGRIRASGLDLTDADKSAMDDFMRKSSDVGINLNIAEAGDAVAPGRAASMENLLAVTGQTRPGNIALNNLDQGRRPGILAAGRNMVDDIGPGIEPAPVQKAAKSAIDNTVDDMIARNADPLYNAAASTPVKVPKTDPVVRAALKEAEKGVMGDDIKMAALAKAQGRKSPIKGEISWYDAVKKQLDRALNEAEKNGDAFRYDQLSQVKKNLLNVLDTADPQYAMARKGAEEAFLEGERLSSGPLGALAKSTKGQGSALFGPTNTIELAMAKEAADKLPQGMPRSILSNVLDTAVNTKEVDFAKKALPTDTSREMAKHVMGADFAKIGDTLDAARAVKKAPSATSSADNEGWMGNLYRTATNLGAGRAAEKLYDPKVIEQLGELGPLLKKLIELNTALSASTDLNKVQGDTRKKKREEISFPDWE